MTQQIHPHMTARVLDFLNDFESVRFADGFAERYGLPAQDAVKVLVLAEAVAYGEVPAQSLPQELSMRFGFSSDQAQKAAIELATARLLPIQEVVPGIELLIKNWGGQVEVTAHGKAMSVETFVASAFAEVLKEVPVSLQPRLARLLERYALKEVSAEFVREAFERSDKVGGLSFEPRDAETLLAYADEKNAEWIPAEDSQAVNKETKQEEDEEEDSGSLIPEEDPHLREQQDAEDVAQIAKKQQAAMETPIVAAKTVEEMIEHVCALEPMRLPDGTLVDRCRLIVEARLRDVRSAQDTQKQIEKPVEHGGLGITGRKLVEMMQAIEQGVLQFGAHAKEKWKADHAAFVDQKQQAATAKAALAQKEEQLMTKRFMELTGKMPDAHVSPAAPSVARVTAARTVDQQLALREQQIDTEKVRTMVEQAKGTAATTTPRPNPRPVMNDVSFVKRLSGPIDELRTMSLVNFRRIARSPVLASDRLRSLVQLSADQGFEKRIEAVRAWQSSPLYHLYTNLTRDALANGISLEEARVAEQAKGDSLSEEELVALIALNNDLRF